MDQAEAVGEAATERDGANAGERSATISAVGRLRPRPWAATGVLLGMDITALVLANLAAVYLRYWAGGDFAPEQYLQLWPALALFPFLFALDRLYQGVSQNGPEQLRLIVQASTVGYLFLGAIAFMRHDAVSWSRLLFLMAWAFTCLLVPLGRAAVRRVFARRAWWGHPAAVLGAGKTGELIIRQLQDHPAMGLRPVAVLDDDPTKHGVLAGVPVVGGLDLAPRLARECGIRHAIVAMPGSDYTRLRELDEREADIFPHLIIIPPLVGFTSLWVEAKEIGGTIGLEVKRRLLLPWPRAVKRVTDLAMTILVTAFSVPLMLIIATLIKLSSRGPVLYRQERIGRNGQRFRAWKFRSMVRDADAVLERYLSEHPELRSEWERDQKLRDDPRVTWIGRWLRRTSLDELPQLWNVFRGEMSLVGPRPIVTDEVARYGEAFRLFTRVRPGVTGLWQISGRNDLDYDQRVALDTYYVRNWSPWLDLYILARTVKVVLVGKGAY
ncbi:MAG: undecaprenyl-phosphate galactose phosphotransferase WbaP [Planctomycetota bacterium]